MKNATVTRAALVAFVVLGFGSVALMVGLQRRESAPPTASALAPEPVPDVVPGPPTGPMTVEAAQALVAAARAGRAPATLVEAALPSGAGLSPERRALFLDAQADNARLFAEAYRRQGHELSLALDDAPAHDAMPVEVLRTRIADSEVLAQAHAIVANLYESATHP